MNELLTVSPAVGAADLMTARVRSPRLCAMKRENAVEAIRKIIYKMTLYRGQAPDAQMLAFTSAALYDELVNDKSCGLPYITIPEIEHVVKQAVLHKDIYLSVASVYAVLSEYARGEGHELEKQYVERKRDTAALPDNPQLQRFQGMIDHYTDRMVQQSKFR